MYLVCGWTDLFYEFTPIYLMLDQKCEAVPDFAALIQRVEGAWG